MVIEPTVLVFHPENIELGNDVYIGHYTILEGYYKNKLSIASGTSGVCFRIHGALYPADILSAIRLNDHVLALAERFIAAEREVLRSHALEHHLDDLRDPSGDDRGRGRNR